jgi:tyrosyl-tRNA synthetase
MNLSEDLAWRGLIKDKTFSDINWLDEPKKFYLGLDASADSFTIGNLAALLLARRLIDAGWEAVLLAGGATSLIGDPGGKEEERELKNPEEISNNIEAIKEQIKQVLAGENFELVNNYDWFEGIKFLENKGVVMQIGASDQWGNMLSGVPLIRKREAAEAHALSMPLVINKTTGRKFGKSEEGAIWLDGSKTTPFKFYQFWINVDDDSAIDYLKIYTLLSKEAIEKLSSDFENDRGSRSAQKALAYEVTKIVHGQDQADKQQHVTEVLFSGEGIAELDESKLATIHEEFPNHKVSGNSSIIEALNSTGLVQSNSEGRRMLESGAIYINGQSISRDNFEGSDFQNGRLLLRRGKAFKDSALIELV